MNRRELIRAVAAHTADDVKHVESLLSGVTDVITAVVAKGEAVTIQRFAKFARVERAARMGRNPRTGEQIRIKASKRVHVSPMKAFNETVTTPSHAPRLSRGVYPTSPELLAKQAAERRMSSARRAGAAAAGSTAGPRSVGTKKTAAKKVAAKKVAATRAPAKKTAAKKVAAKKVAATRAPAKKTAAKKTAKKAGARR